MTKFTIAITGHRPHKLWGYDYHIPEYYNLGKQLRSIILDRNATHIISGVALGVDTIFALVGLKLKQSGHDLQIECAVPCINQSSRWYKDSVDLYNSILKQSDKVTYVSNKPYSPQCMQDRNKYMVDNCDLLIAVWNGTSGGTANCIKYAKSQHKPIVYINPNKGVK